MSPVDKRFYCMKLPFAGKRMARRDAFDDTGNPFSRCPRGNSPAAIAQPPFFRLFARDLAGGKLDGARSRRRRMHGVGLPRDGADG